MPYEFKIVRRVEFSETDMAGIVHYSNFFRYMESAEHAFFRSLGFSVVTRQVDPPVGWPRVHAECDYKLPLRFEDEFEIHMLVSEKRSKSLSYVFLFRKLNADPPVEVARGSLTVVCVTHDHGRMKAATIPKAIADQIQVAPAEKLSAHCLNAAVPKAAPGVQSD
jgi:YbgC/YbaW family acyl-CoA thioester hydrolase